MSLLGKVLGGRYEVLRLLGTGGMGAVYEAQQRDLNRRVAIKVLHDTRHDPGDLARFRQEAQAAASLGHPNIVQIIDFEAKPGEAPFMVMELLRGRSLSALVRQEGRLPPARAASLMVQVLSALAAAHRARIVHRDVKPENIFVCDPSPVMELVKVLDFGFAKPLDSQKNLAKTQAGYVVGTPAYMAPEQASGAAADARMDLFAVGVSLYYALAGRRPFEGPTTSALMYAIRKQAPLPLASLCPDLDLELVRVVERALAKEPKDRYASAEQFIEALAPWSGGAPVPRAPQEAKPQGGATKREGVAAPKNEPAMPGIAAVLPASPFRVLAPRIADKMVRYARFSATGAAAMAVGPTGLAKWAGGAGAGRALPEGMHAEWVRGFEFAPNGDALVFGIDGRAFFRDARQFRPVEIGEQEVALMGAHVDGEDSILFAAVLLPSGGPPSKPMLDAGLQGGDGAILHWSPQRVGIYPVGRNIAPFAVTRASSGAAVACGERGAICVLDPFGGTHARTTVRASLVALTALPGDGVVAVGREGALVHLETCNASGVANASVTQLVGPNGPEDLVAAAVGPDGRVWIAGARSLFAGPPRDLRLVASGGAIDAPIVALWAGDGRTRMLLENATILELQLSAGP